jgi:tRNA dimethylallyltransferase
MMEQGLLQEVQALHQRPDLHTGLPSVRCVGYRQLWDYLDGRQDKRQAIEQAIAATRQLAKRQLTWLRSQPDRHIIDCLAPDAARQAVDKIAQFWPDRPLVTPR